MSTETFYICWCGNRESNHNFKHSFSPSVKVIREKDSFILSALDYPVKEGEKCTVPGCTAQKAIHRKKDTPRLSEILNPTTIIDHDFQPEKYSYRDVKFSVPPDARCLHIGEKCRCHTRGGRDSCGLTLGSHHTQCKCVLNHHFTTKISILHLERYDKTSIFSRENEDVKILNNYL